MWLKVRSAQDIKHLLPSSKIAIARVGRAAHLSARHANAGWHWPEDRCQNDAYYSLGRPLIVASLDYYEILGVSRKAAAKEVRRAYRALARKYHPDFNPADKGAAQKFREIQEAYEVLGNSRKRKAYDYYGPNFGERVPTRNVVVPGPAKAPSAKSPSEYPHYASTGTGTADRSGSGRFSPLTLAILGRAAFAAVFLGGAFAYFLWPNPSVRELQRAQEALRHAKSWKMERNSTDAQYLDEMSCPSSERFIQHLQGSSAGRPFEFTFETVIIGNVRYSHTNQSKDWMRDWAGGAGPANTCAKLSRGQDGGQLPALGEWLSGSYSIEKQGLRETTDGKCREWKILIPGKFSGAPGVEFVCLGVKDHLPKFGGFPGSREESRFYDWNVPIDLQAPDMAANRP